MKSVCDCDNFNRKIFILYYICYIKELWNSVCFC